MTPVVVVQLGIKDTLGAYQFTNVTSDVVLAEGMRIRRGIVGSLPTDRVASTGTCSFSLRNDANNSAGLAGYYSPYHANCMTGFAHGIKVKVSFGVSDDLEGDDRYVFTGRLSEIAPVPGQYIGTVTRCVAVDWMEEAALARVNGLTEQVNKRADELLDAITAAMPDDSQPEITDFATGVDTFPYAFDQSGADTNALSQIQQVVQSELGYLYVNGIGLLVFENRNTRAARTSSSSFDNTMSGLRAPTSLASAYNHVTVTIHPRTVGGSAVVLYSLPSTPSVGPGQSITLWGDYSDPDNRARYIGGTDTEAVAATTDYTANSAADGSGTNLTSSIAVTATAFASAVKFEVVNNHATTTAYITKLQIRGKAITDDGPITCSSLTTSDYGQRTLALDLPLQASEVVAQGAADYFRRLYGSNANRIESMTFAAHSNATLLQIAILRDVGDLVTVTETMTGLSAATAFIQSVEYDLGADGSLWTTWGLAPAWTGSVWLLDDATASELNETTVLGYL